MFGVKKLSKRIDELENGVQKISDDLKQKEKQSKCKHKNIEFNEMHYFCGPDIGPYVGWIWCNDCKSRIKEFDNIVDYLKAKIKHIEGELEKEKKSLKAEEK